VLFDNAKNTCYEATLALTAGKLLGIALLAVGVYLIVRERA